MPTWASNVDELFYEDIKRDFEGAKINDSTMPTILRRYMEFRLAARVNEVPAPPSIRMVMDEVYAICKQHGWDPLEGGVTHWLETRLVELESCRQLMGQGIVNPHSAAVEIKAVFYGRIGELFSSGDNTDREIAQSLLEWFKTTEWA